MAPGRPNRNVRGPQEFRPRGEPQDGGERVLIPLVLGGVIHLARRAAGFTNPSLATALNVSSPTVTHLELGVIAATAYHLDLLAHVLTEALREKKGLDHPGWQGWQLMYVASRITDELEALGHVGYWNSPRQETDPDQYLHGAAFLELIETLWPPEYEDRLR